MNTTTLRAPTGRTETTTQGEFFSTAAYVGLTNEQAQAAWDNLSAGKCRFLVMSGKMGSGKDTLAPLVLEAMGILNAEHMYYANALKDEADAIFATIRSAGSREQAVSAVRDTFTMPEADAQLLVDIVYDDITADLSVHARSRTNAVRVFLQKLGTDVRRKQDEDYWVRIGTREALLRVAAGTSVYVTDARFPNEVSFARALGAVAVRLQISEETQAARLLARDGSLPDPSAFTHPSETALDDFTDYTAVIENDGSIATAVHAIASLLVDGYVR